VKLTAAVITVSDSSFEGTREDLAGPALQRCLQDAGYEVVLSKIVSDERQQIASALREAAVHARFIVTTGGTGIGPRDVTPEATASQCDRLLDGIVAVMRGEGLKQTPYAALSRGICGTIGTSLVLNVPGNPAGAESSLKSVLHLIPHALDLLIGKTQHA
jgi:molybdenum cofactor synthesis domain-containing protein